MTIQEIEFATPAFDENLRLRNDILRVPLNMEFYVKDIATEYDSFHLGAYSRDGELAGSLILKPLNEKEVKMRQVAVAEKFQKQGIGKKLVTASEKIARERGFTEMTLHARETAVPFYLQQGYKQVGERFEEVNIPHFKMRKELWKSSEITVIA